VSSFLCEYILSDNTLNNFTNLKEAEQSVELSFFKMFKDPAIPERGLLLKQTIDKLMICLNAAQYNDVNELSDAFSKFKVSVKVREPTETVIEVLGNVLYIRIPNVLKKSDDVKNNLAYYIYFCKIMLNKNDDNTRIKVDENLGDVCQLSVKTKNAMDELIASAKSATGLVGGKTFKLEPGLQGPACSLIAALRLLNRHAHRYVKIPKKKQCNTAVLRDALNSFLGLKEPGVSKYAVNLLKQCLNLVTKPTATLPAGFHTALKTENNAETQEALFGKMGYVCVNPAPHKVISVAKINFEHTETGQVKELKPVEKGEFLRGGKHYHSAVKLLLPYLEKGSESLQVQLNKADNDLSLEARKFFQENSAAVMAYNRSYAFLTAHKKGKKDKKTVAASVVGAATMAARTLTSKPFVTRNGTEYTTYMDLGIEYRRFFERLLSREESPAKRKADDIDDSQNEDGDKEAPTTIPEGNNPPEMKRPAVEQTDMVTE
jgi:hypothetical protein